MNINNISEKARTLRGVIEKLSINLDDVEALESVELFPSWKPEQNYTKDQRIKYNNILYKVLQDHISQPDWAPTSAPSLFAKILIPTPTSIPVWEKPNSTNAYMTGAKVFYPTKNDNIYQSTIDNNLWSPVDYPQGWELVIE